MDSNLFNHDLKMFYTNERRSRSRVRTVRSSRLVAAGFAPCLSPFPIESEVLMDHLTSEYGVIVERVVSERTRAGQEPVYARIILKSPAYVDLVLPGQPKLTMKVQGRDAWVRPYVTRRKKPTSKARQGRRRQAGSDNSLFFCSCCL